MAVSGADADTALSIKLGYFNLDHRASEPENKIFECRSNWKVHLIFLISKKLAKKIKAKSRTIPDMIRQTQSTFCFVTYIFPS